ncbi:MAG TPA: TIGR02466 family protein [Gammaproteobacteria bacterium]|nr:TIGR02466 family protein [Gammaproteobacteria bacterium]
MNLNLIDLFPRTIGAAKLETLTPDVIRRAIQFIDQAEKTGLPSDGLSTKEQQILDLDFFAAVKQEVIALCKGLSQAYGHEVDDIAIANSWANVIWRGQSIRNHRHNNSYISGSFYLSYGSTFNITNSEYHNLFGFMPRTKESSYRSWESFWIRPEPGAIVLFPSGLYHNVSPEQSDGNRYSVAFNAVPVGRIGVPTSLLELRPR